MNKVWMLVHLFSVMSVICVTITILSFFFQIWNLPKSASILGNLGVLSYIICILLASAWLTNKLIERGVDNCAPIPLEAVKSYIEMFQEIGLFDNKVTKVLLRSPCRLETRVEAENDSVEDQRLRDEMQCEMELLLNELHRLLVASWFDGISPKDPDFPRSTRQALSRVADNLKTKAAAIQPIDAAKFFIMLLNSHLHKVKHKQYTERPLENGSAENIAKLISEAFISCLTPQEICAPPGGQILASLLSHGALLRAVSVVSSPGWLSLKVAEAITGQSNVTAFVNQEAAQKQLHLQQYQESKEVSDTLHLDVDAESAVQEACTPAEDPTDLLMWPAEVPGSGPKLWGTCSLQPEQPSLPQIVEPVTAPLPRKACEAEWLNPASPRQLGLQLSKSSQDLRQVSRELGGPTEELKNIKKELSLGSFMREETTLLSNKVREASSDVLGSLRARATSHLSALLSPAREATMPPVTPSSDLEQGEGEDEMSPVYEEASDLASSIAKLRALLQNHENKGSTDDEATSQNWDSDSEWMEAEEAPELPNDGRPIMNISIPATELSSDSSGQQFVQYCIQYDAVYVHEGEEGPRLVLQTMSVKRRFQEFLNLQNRLEENPQYRAALKAVKGPSRWLSLAFSKAGHQTTAARLPVLEKFLQQLCEQPILARSAALRHFLAYGSEHAVAFPKQEGIDLPRIDKILARTVSGVFHSIKTALPSFDFELSPATSLQHLQQGISLGGEENRTMLPGLLGLVGRQQPRSTLPLSFMEKPAQSRDLARDIHKFLSSRIEPATEAFSDQNSRKVSRVLPIVFRPNEFWRQLSLTSLVNELLDILLPECWVTRCTLPQALRFWFKEWTEEKLEVFAGDFWSLRSAVLCLRVCRAALVPGNSVRKVSREEGQTALKAALKQVFPGWVQIVLGGTNSQNMMKLLAASLYEEQANQQLMLNLGLAATYTILSTSPITDRSPVLI